MPRSTLGDVRFRTRTSQVLNLCRDDPRVTDYVNEAQRLLLDHGHWYGTMARYRICAISGCLTLPSQLSTIEKIAICGQPIPVHDYWFEYLEQGWGTFANEGFNGGVNDNTFNWCRGGNCGVGDGANLIGNFPTFDDVRGVNKLMNVTCDLASDVGKQVLLLGYDENLNWIRTEQDGVISDGELVTMAQSAGTNSTHLFSSVTDIQPPDDLDGMWWLYEYNTDDTTRRMVGRYDYWELRPSYKRYRVNGLWGCAGSSTSDVGCRKVLIEVLAKVEFIPVKRDTDYLMISNLTAIKDGCLAIRYAEPPADMAKSEMFLQRALRALNLQTEAELGSSRKIGMNVGGTGQFAAGPVEAFM